MCPTSHADSLLSVGDESCFESRVLIPIWEVGTLTGSIKVKNVPPEKKWERSLRDHKSDSLEVGDY